MLGISDPSQLPPSLSSSRYHQQSALYITLWYVAPLSIQKLLLLLLRSVKDFKLDIAGVFIPSLEGFSTLITSALSYFTVIYSM
ncbi:PREDICTED: uncharacterized protein LOC105459879 [Wasmannia auropunctata]|uniref:uncharacterized protein LOC105459879 n=1 Tax=Wasmannia auropunctata TaxID=64793 RepID=UPI0005EDEEA0|nr:PREDICTED: uncharacterized protein LOC105459879 [Wasmannia auropunctata]